MLKHALKSIFKYKKAGRKLLQREAEVVGTSIEKWDMGIKLTWLTSWKAPPSPSLLLFLEYYVTPLFISRFFLFKKVVLLSLRSLVLVHTWFWLGQMLLLFIPSPFSKSLAASKSVFNGATGILLVSGYWSEFDFWALNSGGIWVF